MKVLYVTNLPAPYRVEFFQLLGQTLDLTAIYERRSAENRNEKWQSELAEKSFRELCLNARPFGQEFSISLGLVRHLRKHRYDAVIFGGYNSPTVILAMKWMQLHRRPYGITCDGMLPKQGPVSGWKERLKRDLISHADFCLCSGGITARELIGYGAREAQVFQVPFSSVHESEVLESPPDRETAKEALGVPGKTVLLYVGQFIHRKGLDLLVPAFIRFCLEQKDRKAVLFLVGGREEQLRELGLGPLPENVRCVPFLTKQELKAYYQAADLFVLPTREDIWGLVVNEALANGLPVLTTDRCVAGMEMIADNQVGRIVPTESIDALVNGINDCLKLDNPYLNLKIARAYSIEKMASSVLFWLNQTSSGCKTK